MVGRTIVKVETIPFSNVKINALVYVTPCIDVCVCVCEMEGTIEERNGTERNGAGFEAQSRVILWNLLKLFVLQ